ncbi:MAG TPA: tetratricopeptide repeat protein [Bryobacteraceae bacterium]|nr:tetratricopeptide repeat protein [Bryobacteraceae bacterium]
MISGAILLAFWMQAQSAGAAAPAQPPAGIAQAKALAESGKLEDAKKVLDALDPATPGINALKGDLDFRLHHYPQASDELLAAAKEQIEGSDPWRQTVLMLTQSLYLASRPADAIPWLEKARTFGTRSVEFDYMLGNCYVQTRAPEKAVVAFAHMFDVPPDSAAAHLLAGQMMIRQEFEEYAVKELRRALELSPKIPEAHYMLGEIATFHGRFDDAIAELKQEIDLNPNFAMAYYKLGDAYTRREQWDLAAPQLEKAVWLNPTYSGPYILLGRTYLKQNQLSAAENMLRRSLQLDPRNATAHYILGQTLVAEGRTEEGRKLLQESQALHKTAPAAGTDLSR